MCDIPFFRYSGTINNVAQLAHLLERTDPAYLVELSKLVNFLSVKLSSLCQLEDMVNPIERPEEGEMFYMELAGLLRELCNDRFKTNFLKSFHQHNLDLYLDCPYSSLMDGPPLARLSNKENRLKLLNFLISECQAALMNNLENQLEKCSLNSVSQFNELV